MIPHNVELGDDSAMKAQAFRMLDDIIRYKLGRSRPVFVSYYATYRCNRRCMFCDLWKMNAPELTTEDAEVVIDRIADFGVKSLGISGGEPLIRKDLEEIAERARERGIITGLNTNGILITKKRAPAIAKAFDAVSISLDGFEKTHDEIRGVKGTFREAFQGLRNLTAARGDCVVGVNLVLTNRNFGEFLAFCRWIKEYVAYITFFPVSESPGETSYSSLYSIPRDRVDDFVEQVLSEKARDPSFIEPSETLIRLLREFIKGKMPYICDAGRLYLGISPNGDLKICPCVSDKPPWKIGSLLDKSMKELLDSDQFYSALEVIKSCRPCLAGCTTPLSLLFRGSVVHQAKEALKYLKINQRTRH